MTFLERLREQTAERHLALESLPLSKAIISPDIDRQDYIAYLDLMADVISETEQLTFPVLAKYFPDIEHRRKLPLLVADLKHLGASKTTWRSVFGDDASDEAFLLGLLYVVEGSTLGGRFIMKNIEEALHIDSSTGLSYFAGYGSKTGAMWKEFLGILTAYEQECACADAIIAGAGFAFEKIHQHLSYGN